MQPAAEVGVPCWSWCPESTVTHSSPGDPSLSHPVSGDGTVLPEDQRHCPEVGLRPQGHSWQCVSSGQSHRQSERLAWCGDALGWPVVGEAGERGRTRSSRAVSPPWQNFDSEICSVVSDAVWDSREKQQQTLQMAIAEHLYQQGRLSVAEELCQVRLAGCC